MIKSLVASLVLCSSMAASASVVLHGKQLVEECVIKDGKLTKSAKFAKGKLSFSKTESISTEGLESFALKAHSLSTGRISIPEMNHAVEINGVKATLDFNDSQEATELIRFINKACF